MNIGLFYISLSCICFVVCFLLLINISDFYLSGDVYLTAQERVNMKDRLYWDIALSFILFEALFWGYGRYSIFSVLLFFANPNTFIFIGSKNYFQNYYQILISVSCLILSFYFLKNFIKKIVFAVR